MNKIIIININLFIPIIYYILASHVSHLENAKDEQLNTLLGLVFDLDNLSVTVNKDLKKPNIERNYVQEDTYGAVYHASNIVIILL